MIFDILEPGIRGVLMTPVIPHASHSSFILLTALVSACAARGPGYEEVMSSMATVAGDDVRVFFLRPSDRYDDYSASRAIISVNDKRVGKLPYGGFFFVDVDPGSVTLKAAAKSEWHGVCKVLLETSAGQTVYFDVGPRTAHVIAGALGSIIGGVIGGWATSVSNPTVEQILVSPESVGTAVGAVAGSEVATAAESKELECGGPYGFSQLSPSEGLRRLEPLAWSK